ncbi:MAG: hypothetical protein WBE26_03495 [Phycisphaerae bacterium]
MARRGLARSLSETLDRESLLGPLVGAEKGFSAQRSSSPERSSSPGDADGIIDLADFAELYCAFDGP